MIKNWLGPFEDGSVAVDEIRRSVAQLLGEDVETWPSHGNAPLAIASAVALLVRNSEPSEKCTQLSDERIEVDRLARAFGVSPERAKQAQDDLGFMYRKLATMEDWRERELRIQALGAALSRRDWYATERAYEAIRDALYATKSTS